MTKSLFMLFILCSCVEIEYQDIGNKPAIESSESLVWRVQNNLYARGYNTGDRNGELHSQTRDAIKSFQYTMGLDVTGRLNPETLEALSLETQYAE